MFKVEIGIQTDIISIAKGVVIKNLFHHESYGRRELLFIEEAQQTDSLARISSEALSERVSVKKSLIVVS